MNNVDRDAYLIKRDLHDRGIKRFRQTAVRIVFSVTLKENRKIHQKYERCIHRRKFEFLQIMCIVYVASILPMFQRSECKSNRTFKIFIHLKKNL